MSTGLINNDAINDALLRAKELATSSPNPSTLKRPTSDSDDSHPAKRANMDGASIISTIGNMGGFAPQQLNPNENVVEVIVVPDNAVGLVIGKGGSEISQIQSGSGARVQMAPESSGDGTRQCTLQGTKMAVERAKQLIHEVITRAAARRAGGTTGAEVNITFGNNVVTYDMLIPGSKCGLVIGKAGETIRQLQEQSGVKMQMIQDTTESSGQPKPLRMTGDSDKIEFAKRLVQELLNSRGDDPSNNGSSAGMMQMMGGGGGGGGGQAKGEVVVPRVSVGMIIGKGGETIKRLAMETGTKIQFKPDDASQPDRCAVITGTREQIYKATELITELVQKSCSQAGPQVQDTFYMHVPSNKTGLVIGKGGETIKQICQESSAHVELSRDPPPNASEKVFIIKGTAYQIHHAQHVIRIKVGDIAPGTPVPPFMGAGGGATNMFGAPAAPFNGGGFPMAGGQQWNNSFAQPDQSRMQTNGFAMGGAAPQQFYGQQQPQLQAQYQMQQPQQPQFAQMQPQQPMVPQQQPQQVAAVAQPQPAQAQTTTPAINPQTGQPDYSAQWAEYYRNMGMHEQAAKIEAQMRGGAAAQPQQQAQQPQQVQYGGQQQFQTQAF